MEYNHKLIIEKCIQYHDTCSKLTYFESENRLLSNDLEYQYPDLYSTELLKYLINNNSHLSSFILDNVTNLIDKKHNFDFSKTIKEKNDLANILEHSNYYDLFCITRYHSPFLHHNHNITKVLNDTQDLYQNYLSYFPTSIKTRENIHKISLLINNQNKSMINSFFKKRIFEILPYIEEYNIFLVQNYDSRMGVQFDITNKKAYINIVNGNFQLEHLRAFFHALGHSIFFISNINDYTKLLSSDTTSTESFAIFFENLLSDEIELVKYFNLSDEFIFFQSFLNLYYLRLYAIRSQFESFVYKNYLSKDNLNHTFDKLYQDNMFLKSKSGYLLDEKPISLEFFYANLIYLENQYDLSTKNSLRNFSRILREIILC